MQAKIKDPKIRKIVEEVISKLEKRRDIDGIFLMSSYAIGVVTPQSDLDIGVIYQNEPRRETWTRYEIPVHIHFFNRKALDAIKKHEKDIDVQSYPTLIKPFSNIIPLCDSNGIVASLQQETQKKKNFFAKVYIKKMGKQLNDAHGFLQVRAYEDAVLNIREAARSGVLAFLSMIGMPGAKHKYVFSLLSSVEISEGSQDLEDEILQLFRKIHNLEKCNQDIVANYLLSAGRMFDILSGMLEK